MGKLGNGMGQLAVDRAGFQVHHKGTIYLKRREGQRFNIGQ